MMLRHFVRRTAWLSSTQRSFSTTPAVLKSKKRPVHDDQLTIYSVPYWQFARDVMCGLGVDNLNRKSVPVAAVREDVEETAEEEGEEEEDEGGEEEVTVGRKTRPVESVMFAADILMAKDVVTLGDLHSLDNAFVQLAGLTNMEKLSKLWPSLLINLLHEYSEHDQCLEVGKLVFDYGQRVKNIPPLCLYIGLIGAAAKSSDPDTVRQIYKDLCSEYPILNQQTYCDLIRHLAETQLKDECFEMKKTCEAHNFTLTPSAYSALIFGQIKENNIEQVKSLLEELVDRDPVLPKLFYAGLFSNKFDSAAVFTVLGFLRDMHIVIQDEECAQYAASWLSRNGWDVSQSSIYRNQCRACGVSTNTYNLTEEEFDAMKSKFMENVMIGDDIFEKTDPKEFEYFKAFLEKHGRFDIVVDGLNVRGAYRRGCEKRIERVIRLLYESHRGSEPLKLAIMSRTHERKQWRYLEKKFPDVAFFYSNNSSYDDIFLLYAAMYSGPSAYFLTRDKMRNHRYLMGKLNPLMTRWQRIRQAIYINDYQDIRAVQFPRKHSLQIFFDSHSIHIPYHDHKSNESAIFPEKWICARKTAESSTLSGL